MTSCSASPRLCELISKLENGIYSIQITKLSSVSSLSLYIYNLLLTCDDEHSYMWTAKIGPGKVVYFLTRYLSLFVMLFINVVIFLPHATSMLCLFWIRFHWVSGILIGVLTEIPLLLRIYALYNKSRAILTLVTSCLALTAMSMLVIASRVMGTEGAQMDYFGSASDFHMCIPTTLDRLYETFWIPLLLNETLLLSLSLIKWVKISGRNGVQASATNSMIKDSILYFFGTFPFFLLSQLMWAFGGENYIEFPVGLAITMGSIMSQRLLLNIRKYHYGQQMISGRGYGGRTAQESQLVDLAGCSMELVQVGPTRYEAGPRHDVLA